MPQLLWEQCLNHLQNELPDQQFNTWIRPLKCEPLSDSGQSPALCLLAPNRFIQNWVSDKFLGRINEILFDLSGTDCTVQVSTSAVTPPADHLVCRLRPGTRPDGR